MLLNIEGQRLQRPIKSVLDGSESDSSRPTKCQRLSPHSSLYKAVEDWLANTLPAPLVPPARPVSCSPRLGGSDPQVTFDPGQHIEQGKEGEEQRPLLEVLQEMSQLRQTLGKQSLESGQSSRLATSHPGYRKTLYYNGISLDHTGEKIPPELREFLDSVILPKRATQLSPDAIADAVTTAVDITDSPEAIVHDLIGTATLPTKRLGVRQGGNTLWYTDGLPRNEVYVNPLAAPKTDFHCGYPMGERSVWNVEETAVIDHQAASRLTQPARSNCFPFLVCEIKSEAMGGTLWHAENQAAGSGACCVNATRFIYSEAHAPEDESVVDTVAFSACITQRLVVFHVHWYSAVEDRYFMSWIATCETLRDVQRCNHMVLNIFDYCLGPRLKKIRDTLAQLYPVPKHWE